MATTTKKKTTRRKAAVSGPKKTVVIGGKRFTHKMCGTKAAMTSKAKSHREKGKSKQARVVKNGSKYCVYTRG